MRLNAPQYINNSRSDGYLNWEFDADDDKDEVRDINGPVIIIQQLGFCNML